MRGTVNKHKKKEIIIKQNKEKNEKNNIDNNDISNNNTMVLGQNKRIFVHLYIFVQGEYIQYAYT